jgi:hypothetical protein
VQAKIPQLIISPSGFFVQRMTSASCQASTSSQEFQFANFSLKSLPSQDQQLPLNDRQLATKELPDDIPIDTSSHHIRLLVGQVTAVTVRSYLRKDTVLASVQCRAHTGAIASKSFQIASMNIISPAGKPPSPCLISQNWCGKACKSKRQNSQNV